MVERDDPLAAALAHQARIDPILRTRGPIQRVAADQLGRVGCEHLNANVKEMEFTAPFWGSAIIADVVIKRALPALLEPPLRDEHDVGVGESLHLSPEVAAVPGRLHPRNNV